MSMSVAAGVVTAGAAVYGASKTAAVSKSTARKANKIAQEELDFAQEQYQDWKDTYGDVQDNLSEYYTNLTPEFLEVQGLEAFEKEKDLAMDKLRENLAQRGISTSGIAAQTEIMSSISSAEERARIRAAAPMEAAKQQLDFLSVGMGNNPAGNVGNVLSNQASRAHDVMRDSAVAAGNATQSAVTAVTDLATTAYDAYQQRKNPSPPTGG